MSIGRGGRRRWSRRRSSRRHELARLGGDADDRERAALALAHRVEQRQRIGARPPSRSAPGSRCTRFPSATGRSPRAALCAGRSARPCRRRRPVPERRSRCRPRRRRGSPGSGSRRRARAVVDDLLRAALDLGVAALHRVEVELGGVGAGRHRARRAAAHADAHARAAELDQQRAGRELDLVRLRRGDRAEPAGDHDRLVIAAPQAADGLLVDAEIAAQVRAGRTRC